MLFYNMETDIEYNFVERKYRNLLPKNMYLTIVTVTKNKQIKHKHAELCSNQNHKTKIKTL